MKRSYQIYICSFFLGLFSVGCYSQKNDVIHNDKDSAFTTFLSKIEKIKLPFKLEMGNDSIQKYVETTYGNGKFKPNEIFSIINEKDYKFLNDKYPIDDKYLYKALFKNKIRDNHLVLITQNDLFSFDFYWFKLNSYTSSGKLIDTLTIAGSLPFGIDLSCVIDSSFIIKTKADIPIPNSNDEIDSIPALLIYSTYKLTDEGYFRKIESKKSNGYYYLLKNTNKYEFRENH